MKRNIIVKLLMCVLFIFYTSSEVKAQRNKKNQDAALAGVAVLGSIIAAKIAIEEMKELLEEEAVTHILLTYPEIENFRLKCLFEKGEKWSDESGTGVLTFQITILNKAKKTQERKVLLRFNNNHFSNQNGVRINKVEYKLVNVNEWNSIMAFFGNLISVGDSILPISNGSTEGYTNYKVPLYNGSSCSVNGAIKSEYYNLFGDEKEVCFIKTGSSIPISSMKIVKHAFEYPTLSSLKDIFPFYRLKGDDYIVGDYSSNMRIFANENSMGLFLKSIGKTVLLRRYIIGEIHSFLNFYTDELLNTKLNEEKNEIIKANIIVPIKLTGFYYKGNLCEIIQEISDTEVKIKYATKTGRGFYKEIVNPTDIEEVK